MYINILNLFVFYFLIFTAILGYGFLFIRLSGIEFSKINIGFIGLYGIFFLILYSYLSNIFLPHTHTHNLITLIIGIGLFLYFFYKSFLKINSKEVVVTILALFLFFIALLIYKNHDDFPYYHFPYTYYLTQYSLNIGMGIFGHGFRTPSSIFYLNSLFYLPVIKYYSFNFGQIFILLFANLILLGNIFDYKFKLFVNSKKKFDPTFFLSLFSFIFINIFFYRISEHGTDRSAQILIFLLVIELTKLYVFKFNYNKHNILNLVILLTLIISLKSFYILYSVLFLPLFIYIKNFSKSYFSSIKNLFFNFFTISSFVLILLVFLTFFFNTGCFIYPLDFTCFDQFSWSIPKNNVKAMNDWYELWSKAGATPTLRVSDPDIYISSFNWVTGWIDRYFFNKVSDFLLGLLFLTTVILFLFNKNIKLSNLKKINKFNIFTFIIIFFLVVEWFFNHPALRYGGYAIIALIFFIPLSYLISYRGMSFSEINKKIIALIMITIFVFLSRNIHRINKEVNQYNYQPVLYTFYKLDDSHFRIDKKMKEIINYNIECSKQNENCKENKQKMYKKFNINIFIKNK